MNMIIHGKHLYVTPALREYAELKLGSLRKWLEDPVDVHVSMAVQGHKHEQVVEVTIPYHGMVFRSEEKQVDMYTSIDLVSDKLERKLRKFKEKVRCKSRHQDSLRTQAWEMTGTALLDENEFKVMRVKKISVKPVDVEEAILQMNMLDHEFHLFRNKDSNQMELVYRRNDGSYGLITT